MVWTFPLPSVEPSGPAVKSLNFLNKGLARDYHAAGFPEFDRNSRASFHSRSCMISL